MRNGWSWPEIGREVLANATARGSRANLELWLALTLGVVLAGAFAAQWRDLEHQLEAQQLLGRNVLVLAAQNPNAREFGISVASCETLPKGGDIQRSGAVIPVGRTDVMQLGPNVPVVEAGQGLFPQLRSVQALLGSTLADSPIYGRTAYINTQSYGPLEVSSADAQPIGVDVNSSLILPLPSGTTWAPDCVVVLAPYADSAAVTPRLVSEVSARNGAVTATPAVRLTFDVLDAFRSRGARLLALLVGIFAGLFSGGARALRSSEAAAYRLSGTTRLDYARIVLVETVVSAGGLVFAGTVAAIPLTPNGADRASVVSWIILSGLTWASVALVVSTAVLVRSPMSLAKDR